jgi:hypothetical protein
MANSNKPFGLRPVGNLNGSPWNGGIRKFYVPSTDANAIYIGDMVKLAGTEGSLYPNDAPLPTVAIAAANDTVVGVMVGIEPIPTNLNLRHRAASTGMYVFVCVDPQTIYMVQGDADTYDAADVGFNMTLTVAAGSTVTGRSASVADQSTAANTATLDLQVLGTVPVLNNDLTGGYPLLLVKLNNCQYVDGTTGL